MPMCPRRDRPVALAARALEFQPVSRARSPVLTASLLRAELQLDFSLALEGAMFGRSVFGPVGQASIFPREQSVSPRPKVGGSVCLWPICLSALALLLRRLFL